MYPRPIHQLIQAFAKLPGVGPRTAERFVFHLLAKGKQDVTYLADALRGLVAMVRSCTMCFDFSDTSPCALCRDDGRDTALLCIVAEPADVQVIERSGAYRGRYFVLRGAIDPTDDEAQARLKTAELFHRVQTDAGIQEIILAFNPDVAGETTMLTLGRRIQEIRPLTRVSRLARGLPMGSDLRYADDVTLSNAMTHRVNT